MGAMAYYPLVCGLIEQLSVIAAKFGVCFLAPFIITARLFLYISTMHGTLSSLSSIMGAMAYYPLVCVCGLIEQLSVIAAKFGVCTMAPTHTSLQCIIETSWMDASFECHEMMKDSLKFSCFSLHGPDMFITPSGNTPKSLSTVTHARVTHTHQISIYLLHGVAKPRTHAALT